MKRKALLWAVIAIFMGNQAISQDWNYVSSTGTTYILYGMSFPPGQSTVGFACGMQYTYDAPGVIVKTTDGGDNWTQIWPISGTIDGLQGIWFINDNVGFACGWNNYFIKTTDGGATWNTITVGSDVWYYVDVEFWDEYNGVAAASMNNPGTQAVFVTSDGGTTWTPATSGVGTNEIMGLCYADQNTVFAVGTGNNVFKSTDGGHNWTTVATLSALLFGVDFADANFGVVGGEEKIFATNDGGNSWTTFTTGYENFQAAKAFSDGTAYVGGTDENIYKTTDFGASWVLDWDGPGFSHLYRIRFTPNTAGFACGSQGTILKREPQFAAGFSADDPNTCEGSTVSFTDQSIGNVISWEWTFEGGNPGSSTIQNPSVTYSTIGDYDVQLVVSDGVMYDTLLQQDYIHVEAVPQQPDTPTGPDQTCGGGTYDYSTASIANADSYQWMVEPASAGTFSGSGTTGTLNTATDWTGQYTVKVRGENECGQGPWSASLQAELFHQPEQFFLTGGGFYCEGEPGIELILDGSETGVDYELYLDDVTTGVIVPGTGESLSFGYQTETGFYTVIGYTANCEQLMGGESYISVHSAPGQPGMPDGSTEVCQGDTTGYTTSGASGADNYIWTLSPEEAGIVVSTDMTAEIAWSPDFDGYANLTVTAENECGEGPASDGLEIMVLLTPVPEISGLTLVCDNDVADYMTPENSGNSYTWNVTGGSIISGAGTYMISVQWGYPGTGYITVTEDNGTCATTTENYMVTIDDCTTIDEVDNHDIKVYPNPASTLLSIEIPVEYDIQDISLRIRSIMGQMVVPDIRSISGNVFQISLSNYQSGIYFAEILTGNMVTGRIKFIIER